MGSNDAFTMYFGPLDIRRRLFSDKNNSHFTKSHFLFCVSGRTRTKDKYRVVYSDHQRLELEKEFHYSRYITIRRKAELANNVGLSERQASDNSGTQVRTGETRREKERGERGRERERGRDKERERERCACLDVHRVGHKIRSRFFSRTDSSALFCKVQAYDTVGFHRID